MRNSRTTKDKRQLVNRTGIWTWQYDGESAALPRPLFGSAPASAVVGQWERENNLGQISRFLQNAGIWFRRHGGKFTAMTMAFVLGATLASGPNSTAANWQLRERLRRADAKMNARQGELELVRLEVSRLNSIVDNSKKYKIPADLAASIYDIARAEGIDPRIAFGLVNVESEFSRRAVSPVGAVGLTQVMPATAQLLQPGVSYSELFDQETNLRLGFRFLRDLLEYYKGDLNLALTAYNRGPGRVDGVLKTGKDPSNGYAEAVIGGGMK